MGILNIIVGLIVSKVFTDLGHFSDISSPDIYLLGQLNLWFYLLITRLAEIVLYLSIYIALLAAWVFQKRSRL